MGCRQSFFNYNFNFISFFFFTNATAILDCGFHDNSAVSGSCSAEDDRTGTGAYRELL